MMLLNLSPLVFSARPDEWVTVLYVCGSSSLGLKKITNVTAAEWVLICLFEEKKVPSM